MTMRRFRNIKKQIYKYIRIQKRTRSIVKSKRPQLDEKETEDREQYVSKVQLIHRGQLYLSILKHRLVFNSQTHKIPKKLYFITAAARS